MESTLTLRHSRDEWPDHDRARPDGPDGIVRADYRPGDGVRRQSEAQFRRRRRLAGGGKGREDGGRRRRGKPAPRPQLTASSPRTSPTGIRSTTNTTSQRRSLSNTPTEGTWTIRVSASTVAPVIFSGVFRPADPGQRLGRGDGQDAGHDAGTRLFGIAGRGFSCARGETQPRTSSMASRKDREATGSAW